MTSQGDNREENELKSPIAEPAGDAEADGPASSEHDRTVSVNGVVRAPAPVRDFAGPIGGYEVVGVLGEGGMGVVYEAEQKSPHRRVALKVMRRGHTVDEVHARMFHYEAQALARLRHPKIAAIYESGHTPDGHDYFAMELVRGVTLDRWLETRPGIDSADEVRRRLRLFRSICEPIHYAHQRGVIHRDLKPVNIMVTDDEEISESAAADTPLVKVLDFGLARITDPDMQAATLMSEVGVIRGTLPYMSPEQTRSDVDAVDVRTDVYALGVVLYELLTGRRPYDVDSSSLVDALRVICEEPPRPLGGKTSGGFVLDRDLETIVGKALAKKPDQRFGTVGEMAEDVDRYLTSRPIRARRPTAVYRARKFIQRHRAGVVAGAVAVSAVVVGIVGVTLGLVRATDAEAQARREAATSAKVSHFLADMLASVDAQQVGRLLLGDLEQRVAESARERGAAADEAVAAFLEATRAVSGTDAGRRLVDEAILARAGVAVQERFADEPEVGGRLEHTLAETYERLGMYDRAMEHARRAQSVRATSFGADHPETLGSEALNGLLFYRLGEFETAEKMLGDVRLRQRAAVGDDHPNTLWSTVRLAWVLIEQGRLAEAEDLLLVALDHQRRVLGSEHRDTATTMNSLAVVFSDQQRFAEAEALHAEVLAIRSRVLGPSDPDTLKSMTNLAVVSFYQGRIDDSAALFQEVYEIQIQSLGPDHPVTLGSMNNLAVVLERLGRHGEAENLHRRALESKRRVLGADHPETLSSQYNLAIVHTALGRLDEAERSHRHIFEVRREFLGASHPETLDPLCALAGVAALRGDRELAVQLLGEAVGLGYSHGDTIARDSDFASLADDPEFRALVDRAKSNASPGSS